MSNTKYFADLIKVCSVLPVFAVMPAMAEAPKPIDGKISNQTVSNETVRSYNLGNLGEDLLIYKSSFTNNSNTDGGWGGVAHATGGFILTVKESNLTGNFASTGGGAFSSGTGAKEINVIDSKFTNNVAQYDGGAIASYAGFNIKNSMFDSNRAMYEKDEDGNWKRLENFGKDPLGGGALALGAESETVITSISGSEFKNNKSGLNGGAIATRLAVAVDVNANYVPETRQTNSAKLDVAATFENNFAERSGGAIYNTFYNDANAGAGKGVIVRGEFEDNQAGYHGGAIYNDGDKDSLANGAVMTVINGEFERNKAGDSGGAIYNSGELYVNGGTFEDNHADVWAGAIYSSGNTDEYDLKMEKVEKPYRRDTAGVLEIKNATFTGNSATYAGAVAAGTSTSKTIIENTVFKNNTADEIGAVALFAKGSLSGVKFYENKSTSEDASSDGAGALFLGATSSTEVNNSLSNSVFQENKSATRGGAISTRTFVMGNNKNAYLDIAGTDFIDNSAATNGGAFDNYFYHSAKNADAVYVASSSFSDNSAQKGGAVYNRGAESAPKNKGTQSEQRAAIEFDDVKFLNNEASVAGGAIYNETEANVFLSGNNTFTGNTANGVANDIYNDGTLTIASGMTSIDGGINGAGALDIKSGATLNMNYAAIEQGSINIDGTLMASLRNANDTVDIAGTLSGTGNVLLSAGGVGTYDVSLFTDANLNVDFGKTYQTTIEDGVATLGVKDIATIAADTGITGGAAGAVSTLAVSSDANLQKVSLAIQEALNNGDTALVEKEMAKVNPDTKPVGQSVAASVQGQVVSVAAGRMSTVGGATGRAGGDVTGAGFWAQGLVNKSKMGGAFEGRTTGFALGGDTLINDVFTLGGGFAFSDTDVEADGRDTNVESNSVFAYAQYKPSAWYANATVSYTMSDYEEDAQMIGGVIVNNNYDTKAFGVQTMFGYDFASGVTPEAGVRYLYVSQDEHRNGIDNIVSEMDYGFWTGVAGLKYAFAIESDTDIKFSPSLRAAMTYDFTTPDAVAKIVVPGASAYYVDIDSLSRMGGEFGIGLTAEYRGLELSLNYELDLHKDYTSQTGLLKFRYDF